MNCCCILCFKIIQVSEMHTAESVTNTADGAATYFRFLLLRRRSRYRNKLVTSSFILSEYKTSRFLYKNY